MNSNVPDIAWLMMRVTFQRFFDIYLSSGFGCQPVNTTTDSILQYLHFGELFISAAFGFSSQNY